MGKDNYLLKLYDENLIAFTMSSEGGEGFKAVVLWRAEGLEHLFPVEFAQGLTDSSLTRWLEKRIIPRNRAFVEEILKNSVPCCLYGSVRGQNTLYHIAGIHHRGDAA